MRHDVLQCSVLPAALLNWLEIAKEFVLNREMWLVIYTRLYLSPILFTVFALAITGVYYIGLIY